MTLPPLTELVGEFSGTVAVFAVPRAMAEAALPSGLALRAQTLTPASTHPVLVWLGRQRDVRLTHLSALPGFPLDYLEVIAGVPFVGDRAGRHGPWLHLCQLFLDSAMAVFGGFTIWGFPKKMARMREAPGSFEVGSAIRGARVLRGEPEPLGEPAPLSSWPFAGALAALLAQPLVEGAMGNLGPAVVGSTFAWELDRATARPARLRLAMARAFVPSLTGEHDIGPMSQAALGAVHIASRWRLSLPYPAALSRAGAGAR
jgi:hypothetical protein